MKFVKILHYVENSYEDKPAFVILMSDNKEYISNGCVWIENTQENIEYLIKEYDCKKELEELFNSDSIEIKDVRNARWMFAFSNITEFDSNMSNVIDANFMFYKSKVKEFDRDMSSVIDARYMFAHSDITEFDGNMSSVVDARFMFHKSKLKEFSGDMSVL